MHSQSYPNKNYLNALDKTSPQNFTLPERESDEEKSMIKNLENLFTNYTYDNFDKNFDTLYAEEFYFRDAFREFSDRQKLKDYFLKGIQKVESVDFKFNKVIKDEGEYFVEWTMFLKFRYLKKVEKSIGITRFRFNSKKQIIFHQDYFDPTTIFYSKLPVVKQIISLLQKMV